MKKNGMLRRISLVLALSLVLGLFPGVRAEEPDLSWRISDQTVTADLSHRLADDSPENAELASQTVRVSIVLEDKPTVQSGYATMNITKNPDAMAYDAQLLARQELMAETISREVLKGQKLDVVWNLTLVGNVISANVPRNRICAIAALPGVLAVVEEQQYEPMTAENSAEPMSHASGVMTGAHTVWSNGYTGAGSRVAIIDTGTDTDHQSFDNGAYLYALSLCAQEANMDLDPYLASLDLLDTAELSKIIGRLNIGEKANVTADDLYLNEKLPFAYNYVDGDFDVTHDRDGQGEHGSHVAGIAAANRFIPTEKGYVDAVEAVYAAGAAPDAQLITMKVFGKMGGAYESDYMAAIEDAIVLGCDAVNLSLGSANAGSAFNDIYASFLEYLEQTDTVVVMSAGNSGHWAKNAWSGGYLYNDGASFDTVGMPGSYTNSLAVASVDNQGAVGGYFTVAGQKIVYTEYSGFGNRSLSSLDTTADGSGMDYELIFLDGYGTEEEYAGLDVTGKIVFCARGEISFAQKANNAASRGAAAVVICNSAESDLYLDLSGYGYSAPVVSIRLSRAEAIRASGASTMTIHGKAGAVLLESEYHTMSSFSSWGVPGDLSMKPEITAPGGNIWSVWGSTPAGGGSDKYELMSGTSMAAPQITGLSALVAQHLRENDLLPEGMTMRQIVQSLLMSTAQPLKDSSGRYHSILSQGAGLGRADLAVESDSYILVEGQTDGKVKAELRDDPDRKGQYTVSFTLNDLTDKGGSYTLSAEVFTQAVFEESGVLYLDTATAPLAAEVTFTVNGKPLATESAPDHDMNGDGITDAQDADHLLEYLLGNAEKLWADGDISGDGTVNTYDAHILLQKLDQVTQLDLAPGGSVEIVAVITLTDAAKARLETENPDGAYIEAYLHVRPLGEGVSHSIPVLGWYGSWTDASMFDIGSYAEFQSGTEKRTPYLYGLGYGLSGENRVNGDYIVIDYGDGEEYYWGGNPITQEAEYLPQRNAMNNTGNAILRRFGDTLIRSAAETRLVIRNVDTGEVYRDELLGPMTSAYYYVNDGSWYNARFQLPLNWTAADENGKALPEGTTVELSFYAAPEYYRVEQPNGTWSIDWDALGEGAVERTLMTIDNTAPVIEDMSLDQTNGDILTVRAIDNQYIAAVALLNARGTATLAAVPGNQTRENTSLELTMDLSGIFGDHFLVAVYDYAMNATVYEVELRLRGQRPYYTILETPMYADEYLWKGYDAQEGTTGSTLGSLEVSTAPAAVEYVDGYVFTVTGVFNDFKLQVSRDDDLEVFYEADLDPTGAHMLMGLSDLAYNPVDGKLYAIVSAMDNFWGDPYLASIDMELGTLYTIAEVGKGIDSLACDSSGNFYGFAGYSSELYTFTLDTVAAPVLVGSASPYASSLMSSGNLTWNDLTGTLSWIVFHDNVHYLLDVDPATAVPTVVRTLPDYTSGLYIRTETTGDVFLPTDDVTAIQLPATAQTMIRNQLRLNAVICPWTVSDQGVTWASSDDTIATVDDRGVVTAHSKGSVTITATSVIDPAVSAQCTVTVSGLDQDLEAIVWDENSEIWWSSFNTDTLPQWEKRVSISDTLIAATRLPDGTIYAADLDENMSSRLYRVDPVTMEAEQIGGSGVGYFDLAWAPNLAQNGLLLAVYGTNVLLVDPETGKYLGAFNWSEDSELVAIAYCETQYNGTYGQYVDYFYMIDARGRVYKEGFMDMNGNYYYYDGPQRGFKINLKHQVSTPLYHSAHYDADSGYLYWSNYNELADRSELLAVHMGNGKIYDAGSFDAGIWPVGGLMGASTSVTVSGIMDAQATRMTLTEPQLLTAATGSLNGTSVQSHPVESVSVTVPVTVDTTNGIIEISYDPAAMTLDAVFGHTEAFAWTAENGTIVLAYAVTEALAAGEAVANVTFLPTGTESSADVTIRYGECNETLLDTAHTVTAVLGKVCPSAAFEDLGPNEWYHEAVDFVLEEGLMNGMGGAIFAPGGTMNRAQLVTILYRLAGSPQVDSESPFTDVPNGTWYTAPVIWARDNGITTGVTATEFAPDAPVAREQMVAFLARYYALRGIEISGGDLSGYQDADRINPYARDAFAWAVSNGIIQGVTTDTLLPYGTANRAQIATILMRCCLTFGK